MIKKITAMALIFFSIEILANHSAKAQDPVQIHGFLSQGYLKSSANNYLADTEDGTFQFNEFGINFTTDLADGLHMGMQLFARDLGSLGNDDVIIDWAYADYFYKSWLGIRIAGRAF